MTGRLLVLVVSVGLSGCLTGHAQAPDWPDPSAYWTVKPTKLAGLEMTDLRWGHLHHGEPTAQSITIGLAPIDHKGNEIFTGYAQAQFQVRYTVRSLPISPWLSTPPFAFTLTHDAAAIASLPSGIYDLSVDVEAIPSTEGQRQSNPGKHDFGPYPMFLHLGGRPTRTTTVPVLTQNDQDGGIEASQKDGHYVDAATLVPQGYPADPTVTPWHTTPPYAADLWQEPMQPTSEQFLGAQLLWEEPPGTVDAGLRFVRAMPPKFGEIFHGLWNNGGEVVPAAFGFSGHRSFPVIDGPRGVGWTNGYVQGVVDADGRLWMVNVSGQLRVMHPDGELVTVVGWRVTPGQAPVWFLKPLTAIRQHMEFRGAFTSGGWADPLDPGFHQPMDVALDPTDPNRVFVASLYDNAVYQVVVDRETWTGTVSLLAGDPDHDEGYVNGVGPAARFHYPFSLVASLDGRALYVSDHGNDAIRRIEIATREVTTVLGWSGTGPTVSETLVGTPGVTCTTESGRLGCGPQGAVRQQVTVEGVNPTIYFPYTVRMFSTGELMVIDRGLNTLRAINLTTKTARVLDAFGTTGLSAWVWGDVDRWGNAGKQDCVYWGNAVSVGPLPGNEIEDRFNENYRYACPDGTPPTWVFGSSMDWKPMGTGPVRDTRPPHYPWLMAVDPRGALIFGGIGSHGLTRLRVRRPTDPDLSPAVNALAYKDLHGIWNTGARGTFHYTVPPRLPPVPPANPLSLWFGWNAHNYLGLPDAWAVGPTTTDAEIDARFQWPAVIAQDPPALAAMRSYVRLFRGRGDLLPSPPPLPPPPSPDPDPLPLPAPPDPGPMPTWPLTLPWRICVTPTVCFGIDLPRVP